MRKIIQLIQYWFFPHFSFCLILILTSCANREKNLHKSAENFTQNTEVNNSINSEKESEKVIEAKAGYKIISQTYSFSSASDFMSFYKSNFSKSEEANNSGKITKTKRYYENGNIAEETEINENYSTIKAAYQEVQENYQSEKKSAIQFQKYFEAIRSEYYKEVNKNKELLKQNSYINNQVSLFKTSKDLAVKKEQQNTLIMFIVGLILGWVLLPSIFKWLKSLLLRFNPYLNLVNKINKWTQ